MTAQIESDGEQLPVVQSDVYLEIENGSGEILTTHRAVKGASDTRLVSTWNGPALTSSGSFDRKDYFALDAGAATREDGFHKKLANFLGWDLPIVTKFNGSECAIPETLFAIAWQRAISVFQFCLSVSCSRKIRCRSTMFLCASRFSINSIALFPISWIPRKVGRRACNADHPCFCSMIKIGKMASIYGGHSFPLNRPADTFSPTGEKDRMRGRNDSRGLSLHQ
jgi:hypothetical protein